MTKPIIHKKINKYLRIPVAKLDLHGCTCHEAEIELAGFCDHWLKQGGGVKLLIITGQGWHSPEGLGVLQPLVSAWLKQRGYRQRPAKPQDGGNGAIEVDLPLT
jgi:DNA-nicking Smr family endonuclease